MALTVAHFIDSKIIGGCEEVVLLLLAGLARRRTSMVLFHYDVPGIEQVLKEARSLGVSCRVVQGITNRNILISLPRFAQELRRVNPDIFHMHLNWPLGCRYATAAARLAGVRTVIATSHLFSSDGMGQTMRWKFRVRTALIDRYIAVSKDVGQQLCKHLLVPTSKIRVVRNGISIDKFAVAADPSLRAVLNEGRDQSIIFTPARLHKQKGHVHLLQAAVSVPNAVFVLAGDGPERKSLHELSVKLGIADRIRFLGQRQDIPQLLACCDIFVLPSLYEGLPLSVLEALAAGKPILATAIGGTNEAVLHGVTGLLVRPADPAELAAGINSLLGNKEMATRLAEAGRTRAMEEFSSDAMVRGVIQVYEELLGIGFGGASSPSNAA